MFDKIVGSIGSFSYKNRKLITALALILFVTVFILQNFLTIEYSYADGNMIADLFPQDDTVVIVYENGDEDKIKDIIAYLEEDEHITSIQAYANTLGAEMSPGDMAGMMGIPVMFVDTLFYIHENGMDSKAMTLVDFVNFIASDDFINNELFSSMIDDESKGQLKQMQSIVEALASDKDYTSKEIADILGIDEALVRSIFLIYQIRNSNLSNITPNFWASIAQYLGVNSETIEKLFGIQPAESLKFTEFVDITIELTEYANGVVDEEQLGQLDMLKSMSEMIKEEKELTPAELAEFFADAAENDMFNEDTVSLLYVMANAKYADMSGVKIPLYNFFIFLSEEILQSAAFSSFFDESIVAQFDEAKATMQDGMAQLISENYSRMVIAVGYALESPEIYEFYENLDKKLTSTLKGEYYIVGATSMSYEVAGSFNEEFLIISIVTAVVVFIVVWFTFKKFLLSMLLICVIECAVFSMMSVMVIMDMPMYFIPLILVQCILMGSMIDYGILFTTYYMEVRKDHSIDQTLPEVMKRATHSILTSSILIVAVTLICGRFMSGAVASILTTLGIGSLCAILLILFVLPSLLVIFDKHVVKQEKAVVADELD